MPRLFVALSLPESVAETLTWMQGGIRGAKWEPQDKLHLTLRFIGDVEHGHLRRIIEALEHVRHPPFELGIRGVGHFSSSGQPRVLWAGVNDSTDVVGLHGKIERALERVGVPKDGRKFHAHVTLARLHGSHADGVADFLERQAWLSMPPFTVDRF